MKIIQKNSKRANLSEGSSIVYKTQARLTKKKREKTQFTNISYERGQITSDPMNSKKIMKEYYVYFIT